MFEFFFFQDLEFATDFLALLDDLATHDVGVLDEIDVPGALDFEVVFEFLDVFADHLVLFVETLVGLFELDDVFGAQGGFEVVLFLLVLHQLFELVDLALELVDLFVGGGELTLQDFGLFGVHVFEAADTIAVVVTDFVHLVQEARDFFVLQSHLRLHDLSLLVFIENSMMQVPELGLSLLLNQLHTSPHRPHILILLLLQLQNRLTQIRNHGFSVLRQFVVLSLSLSQVAFEYCLLFFELIDE